MSSPRYTVIVPMAQYRFDEPVLLSLRSAPGPLEIFVVEGRHPARQRNAALERAQGEIVVFLDNDCQLSAQYWSELEQAFAKPEVEVVGGPVLLRPEAGTREKIFHALLTHPLVTGPVSARYAARGEFRKSTQTELILCNLAARRSLFTRVGLLSHHLYPNEENEWLERALAADVGIYYDPLLSITRPQRTTWGQFFFMLLRYGAGRTRQFWVSGWHATPYQLTPLVWLIPLAAILLGPGYCVAFILLWFITALGIAFTCAPGLTLGQRFLAGLAAPLIPFTYATGQLLGWFELLKPTPGVEVPIVVCNQKGEKI